MLKLKKFVPVSNNDKNCITLNVSYALSIGYFFCERTDKMPNEFKFHAGELIIFPNGEIDHHATKSLREEIDLKIFSERPQRIVFDFSRTSFMDSSGLGLILGRYRRAKEIGAVLEIVNPGEKIYRILEMAGIDKMISIKGVEK